MARADTAAIGSGIPAATLMDRAGRAVARAALRVVGGRYGRRAVVVAGKGNNGGDGFVAARELLHEGFGVRCLFVGDPRGVTGAAAEHLESMTIAGCKLEEFEVNRLRAPDVIVDAIFGTGFKGRAEGEPAQAIAAINDCDAPVVAVDIPSGVNGTTGQLDGPAVRADVTVAMAAEKVGTALPPGAIKAGSVEVVNIGIPVTGASVFYPEARDVALVVPLRPPDAHKRTAGSVAFLAGSEGMTGAAVLTARAAVRMGAGYATAGVGHSVEQVLSVALPEVLTEVVTDDDVLGPDSVDRFARVLERADALAIGPGLGQGDRQQELVARVCASVDLPLVIDADGLNVLARDTKPLTARSGPCVITPHPAELGRLLDRDTAEIQSDRLGAAREAADEFGCVVVLKGYRSLTAEPGGRVVVNPTGGPELATAGTGDVLTGAVAALLAAGVEPAAAAWAAAYVHGMAGGIAAERRSDSGVLAGDVADALPTALTGVRASAT
jgi:ADP-dependent NAD(P)H-hydrate dehydratase / NAD(P)H-hydrate epimerase